MTVDENARIDGEGQVAEETIVADEGQPAASTADVAPLPVSSSITVAVRVRPLTEKERGMMPSSSENPFAINSNAALSSVGSGGNQGTALRKVISVLDESMLVFDPPGTSQSNGGSSGGRFGARGGRRFKDIRFAFDRVFNEDSSQEEVFGGTTKTLIGSVLAGYNATVFAYGATGCGKTHTISGTPDDPGIIFLTMRELFERIRASEDEMTTELSISYLEVYNETIRDLLLPEGTRGPALALREDQRGVMIAGLGEHHPKTPDDVMQLLVLGNKNRTMSPTCANAVSSRSHAVLQVNVRRRPRTASIDTDVTVATMSIIDLAGSERASVTKNTGERLLEGANINRSLLALGNCINALCDERRSAHIPYRDSKLTRLLKFSLGGNCRTVMIVCVSPFSAHYEETHNTLKYANRAKNIKTKVERNTVSVTMHVSQYRRIITELKAEITELKRKVHMSKGAAGAAAGGAKRARAGLSAPPARSASASSNSDQQMSLASQSIVDRETQRLVRVYNNSRSAEVEFAQCAFDEEAHHQQHALLSTWCSAFDVVRNRDVGITSAAESFYRTAHEAVEAAQRQQATTTQRREQADARLADKRSVAAQVAATTFPGMRRREQELAQRDLSRERDRLEQSAANARLERALAASQQRLDRVMACLEQFARGNAQQLAGLRACLRLAESWGPEAAPQLSCMNDMYMQAIESFTALTRLTSTSASALPEPTPASQPVRIDSSANTETANNVPTTTSTYASAAPTRTASGVGSGVSSAVSSLGAGTHGQLDLGTVSRMLSSSTRPTNRRYSVAGAGLLGNSESARVPHRTVTVQRILASPARRRRITPVKQGVLNGARRPQMASGRGNLFQQAPAAPLISNGGARRVLVNGTGRARASPPVPLRSSLKDPNKPKRVGDVTRKSVVIISPKTEAMQAAKRSADALAEANEAPRATTPTYTSNGAIRPASVNQGPSSTVKRTRLSDSSIPRPANTSLLGDRGKKPTYKMV